MTGWRIGFTLAPPSLSKAMASFQTHVTSGASHPSQHAAAAAFSDERVVADVEAMVSQFQRRRELVVTHFRTQLPGVEFVDPLGAFYFFFRVDTFFDAAMTGAIDFCERLLAEQGVALVPGEAFGDSKWVRLSFAAAQDDIKRALDRIVAFTSKLDLPVNV